MKIKSTLLFSALLISINTSAQTPQLVYDIQNGKTGSEPSLITPFNNKLFFIAYDSVDGRELRSYDGNPPALVCDLNPGRAYGGGAVAGNGMQMGVLGNKLYFNGSDSLVQGELYAYDGTNLPILAAEMVSGRVVSSPSEFITFDGKLFFTSSTTANGTELLSYDGINQPELHDINPGTAPSAPHGLTPYNGKLYFSAIISPYGAELCAYDPLTDSTQVVLDIDSGYNGSYPSGMISAYGKLWFAAMTTVKGCELYVYDGSTVTRLTDLSPGRAWGVSSTGLNTVAALTAYNGSIFFSGCTDGKTSQLYRYDTATKSAVLVSTINPTGTSALRYFREYDGKLYFQATDGTTGIELWMTDGVNTTQVADLNPGSGSSQPQNLTVWNGALYMTANNGTSGSELFRLGAPFSGLENMRFNGTVKVYPNPATNNCNVEISLNTPQLIGIGLTDAQGKVVWRKGATRYNAGTHIVDLPLQQFAAGTYFYHLSDGAGKLLVSGSVVKQ